jgi:2-polyprenyl-3-methyl-5-hydroxy-6-metoxy-1,4-benzoquinol methylase
MRFVKLDPPGTWCHHEAVLDLVRRKGGSTFLEVGCGAGSLSAKLCGRGLTGTGIDFSSSALEQARTNLRPYLEKGSYRLFPSDLFHFSALDEKVDWGLSMMVMEHVEDDVGFVAKLCSFVKPRGHVLIGVPGRRDCWGIEDETVGHVRRYDNSDLKAVLERAGLREVQVISVAVPVANLLFHIGNLLIRNSREVEKLAQSPRAQTETSGIREIPFKTVFPPFCKVLLNRVTLSPLLVLQRFFYNTNLGLTQLGLGRCCI